MIRLRLSLELDYEIAAPGCDFVFNIHAALTQRQVVVEEGLTFSQNVQWRVETDAATRNRYLRVQGLPGPLRVVYGATVDLLHHVEQPERIGEVPVAQLPADVLRYIYPSRYCQSDRLHKFAMRRRPADRALPLRRSAVQRRVSSTSSSALWCWPWPARC